MNSRVGRWLLERLEEEVGGDDCLTSEDRSEKTGSSGEKSRTRGITGWALMDFYDEPVKDGIVPLLVELNYRRLA